MLDGSHHWLAECPRDMSRRTALWLPDQMAQIGVPRPNPLLVIKGWVLDGKPLTPDEIANELRTFFRRLSQC
jgi:hypothetical protein